MTDPSRRYPSRREALAASLAVLALAAPGCGSSSGGDTEGAAEAPPAEGFPSFEGETWSEVARSADRDPQIVIAPASSVFEPGSNRFSFGVFEVDRTQIPDADVAIYLSRGADGEVEGPYPARRESLQTEAAFASETVSDDPTSATVAYVSEVEFDRPGEWRPIAVMRDGGEAQRFLMPSVEVGEYPAIPGRGEMAPKIHTPTVDDVGDIRLIETRSPPDTMHETDFADVVGKQPVVLLFSTPALCASRVCGPVVDVAEQVHEATGDEVAFIHQEVYVDNDPGKGVRPQLKAYGLQTEPWLFVVDAEGRIDTRIEGAFSVADLERAVERVRG
jgi:hypothetical protein